MRRAKNEKSLEMFLYISALICLAVLMPFEGVSNADEGCIGCHEALSRGASVHAAISMGCTTCHSGINTEKLPHRVTNHRQKGLSGRQPESCYGCHDKAKYEKKTVHGAITLGCTSCHNPHASKGSRLLVSSQPALCSSCHEEVMSDVNHSQVRGTACTTCHDPHATDTPKLLTFSTSQEKIDVAKK